MPVSKRRKREKHRHRAGRGPVTPYSGTSTCECRCECQKTAELQIKLPAYPAGLFCVACAICAVNAQGERRWGRVSMP